MIYFLVYLFLEVMVSTSMASALGGLVTFFEILFSAMVGISILINFRKSLVENMTAVSYNCIDLEQFQRLNLFTLFGAILLIVPGFLTDIIGILMQFSVFTTMVVNRFHMKTGNCHKSHNNNYTKDDNVIDAEIIDNNSALK